MVIVDPRAIFLALTIEFPELDPQSRTPLTASPSAPIEAVEVPSLEDLQMVSSALTHPNPVNIHHANAEAFGGRNRAEEEHTWTGY